MNLRKYGYMPDAMPENTQGIPARTIAIYKEKEFPPWTKPSLEELKHGNVLNYLKEWLHMEVLG